MFIVLPVCHKDTAQAVKLLELSLKFKYQTDHHLFVMYAPDAAHGIHDVLTAARKAFRSVIDVPIPSEVRQGWPHGPNGMFFHAVSYFQVPNQIDRDAGITEMDFHESNGRFLWLEPDSVILHSTWLERIETNYNIGGKPFMGTRVPTYSYTFPPQRDGAGNILKDENDNIIINREAKPTSRVEDGQHMCGVGVYPRAFTKLVDWWRCVLESNTPFDVLFQNEILKRTGDGGYYQCTDTYLISHNTGSTNYRIQKQDDGIFIVSDSDPQFPCGKDKFIWSPDGSIGAVLLHGAKDDSAIRVSEQLNGILPGIPTKTSHLIAQPWSSTQNIGEFIDAADVSLNQAAQNVQNQRVPQQYAINQQEISQVQTSGYIQVEQDREFEKFKDPQYAQFLKWKEMEAAHQSAGSAPKTMKTKAAKVAGKVDEELIIHYINNQMGTWRGTLAQFKLSPKVLKPIFEKAKARKAAEAAIPLPA